MSADRGLHPSDERCVPVASAPQISCKDEVTCRRFAKPSISFRIDLCMSRLVQCAGSQTTNSRSRFWPKWVLTAVWHADQLLLRQISCKDEVTCRRFAKPSISFRIDLCMSRLVQCAGSQTANSRSRFWPKWVLTAVWHADSKRQRHKPDLFCLFGYF